MLPLPISHVLEVGDLMCPWTLPSCGTQEGRWSVPVGGNDPGLVAADDVGTEAFHHEEVKAVPPICAYEEEAIRKDAEQAWHVCAQGRRTGLQ